MNSKTTMPEPMAYPSDEWVEAFFGQPDESGFYYFRGDYGNVVYRYVGAAKFMPQQPAASVQEPIVPDGWQLVPKELIDFLDAKEHHLPVEDRHALSIMLSGAPKFGEEE